MDHNIKAYYEALLLNKIRQGDNDEDGEGQFGLAPPNIDLNHVLKPRLQNTGHAALGPKAHPLLKGQQFSGIDKTISPNPKENSTAQELYPQLRRSHQLSLRQKQKKNPPRLIR